MANGVIGLVIGGARQAASTNIELKTRINVYYRDALAKFRGENWQEALELFLYCQDIIPGDPVIRNYIDRCTSELDIDINRE